ERAVRIHSPVYARTRIGAKPKGSVRDLVQGKVLIVKGPTAQQSFDFPRAGRYTIRVQAKLENLKAAPATMEVRLGAKAILTVEVKNAVGLRVYETTIPVEKGPQNVSATATNGLLDQSGAEAGSGKAPQLQVAFI